MNKGLKYLGYVILGIGLGVGLAAVFSWLTQWAWNVTIPVIFGLTKITLKQAFALNVLGGMFFKSNVTTSNK